MGYFEHAPMAKLVDARDLKSLDASRASSILAGRTKRRALPDGQRFYMKGSPS